MTKLLVLIVVIGLASSLLVWNVYAPGTEPTTIAPDYQNITYRIEGNAVKLTDGVSEVPVAPGAPTNVVTRYFGNEFWTDLNGDGRDDVVFLVTQQPGGSGTFYYVVAALSTKVGFVGSDGFLLGDRIAPQTIELSQNPRHVQVVVANYADRLPEEPMTAEPSVGKSAYLKIDQETMQWGIVEPDFEGESAL